MIPKLTKNITVCKIEDFNEDMANKLEIMITYGSNSDHLHGYDDEVSNEIEILRANGFIKDDCIIVPSEWYIHDISTSFFVDDDLDATAYTFYDDEEDTEFGIVINLEINYKEYL